MPLRTRLPLYPPAPSNNLYCSIFNVRGETVASCKVYGRECPLRVVSPLPAAAGPAPMRFVASVTYGAPGFLLAWALFNIVQT